MHTAQHGVDIQWWVLDDEGDSLLTSKTSKYCQDRLYRSYQLVHEEPDWYRPEM